MLQRIVLVAALIVTDGSARTLEPVNNDRPEAASETQRSERTDQPAEATLTEIMSWLSSNFDLPAISGHPRIRFVSPAEMAAIRYRGLGASLQARVVSDEQWLEKMRDVMALYEDAGRTIYLREGWTGATPGEMSVLVHEMVHHLQNVAGEKFECAQAREKPAYAAQKRWMEQAGRDFFQELEIDPMTMLMRTSCF